MYVRGMFRPCSRYVSTELELVLTVHELCFDRARGTVSIVLEVYFNRARGMFRPSSRYVRQSSRYDLTVFEVRFDCARVVLRMSSRYVSTVLEVHCLSYVRLCTRYVSTARGIFLPCSSYVSTVLEVCFDRARGIFDCSYFPTVLEVCFDRAQSMFRPSFEVCFDRARGMFRACKRYVSTVFEINFVHAMLDVCFDRARGRFQPCSGSMIRPCTRYARGMLFELVFTDGLCFYRARGMFRSCRASRYVFSRYVRPCSTYDSTVF